MGESFSSIKSLSKYVTVHPPPLFLTSIIVDAEAELSANVEQEGRYMASWNTIFYKKVKKEGTQDQYMIYSYKDQSSSTRQTEIPLDTITTASPKLGVKNKQWVLYLTRDGTEFGSKLKDGIMKKSPRTSYAVAFKTEAELLSWISSINYPATHSIIS